MLICTNLPDFYQQQYQQLTGHRVCIASAPFPQRIDMYGHTPTEFSVKMLHSVMRAGDGLRGRDPEPWIVLAEYVAEIERRLAELEAKANSSELHLPKD